MGDIEDIGDGVPCVRCPWHSWRFRLDSGHVIHPRGQRRHAQVFPVSVHLLFEEQRISFDDVCSVERTLKVPAVTQHTPSYTCYSAMDLCCCFARRE